MIWQFGKSATDLPAGRQGATELKRTTENKILPDYVKVLAKFAILCCQLKQDEESREYAQKTIEVGEQILKLKKWKDYFGEVRTWVKTGRSILKEFEERKADTRNVMTSNSLHSNPANQPGNR